MAFIFCNTVVLFMRKELLMKLLAWEKSYKETDDIYTMVGLMQELINTGEIRELPERYMGYANSMVELGLCTRPTLRIVKDEKTDN